MLFLINLKLILKGSRNCDDIDKSSKIVLLRKMIPIIKNKFMVDSSDINYCKIIEWCLENGLLSRH